MPHLRRTALGKGRAKATPPRPLRLTESMVQHLSKRVRDAQHAVLVADRDPMREMKRRREEFERTGKTTIHEDGKTAAIERVDNGLRVRFTARKGVPVVVLRFQSGEEAGRWFDKNFPKHARM